MDNDWRNEQIRCEHCGEYYAATYKRCPFCDGKGEPEEDDFREEEAERRRSNRGGRRAVKTNRRGGGYGRHVRPVQVIGLILSMLLIVAAVYIVFTVISPLLVGNRSEVSAESTSQPQSDISASVSGEIGQPDVSAAQPDVPDVSVSQPDVSTPVEDPVVTPETYTATGITLNVSDFTLKPDETYRIRATLEPQGCTDPITWTSSNETAAVVGADGSVSNVNTGASTIKLTVTATVGNVSTTTIVRSRGGSTGTAGSTAVSTTPTTPTAPTTTPTAPTMPSDGQTASGGAVADVTVGKQAFISEGGVRIRSGAGTEHSVQVTASQGAAVTVLEDCGNGWYKIQYIGNGSTKEVGYISGAFLKKN